MTAQEEAPYGARRGLSALGHGPGHSTEPESMQEPNALKSPGRGMLGRGWHLQRDSAGKLNAARQIAGSIIQASAVPASQLSRDESSR